jgi:pyrroloquinoline quinone biosynthesis protein E
MEILFVIPDYYSDLPKPCMGGWASQVILIQPTGKVLPCHAAEIIPGMRFENVREKSLQEIWLRSESFNRFRGTDWMPEPCRSCDRREVDFGGCRCQAMMLTGDPRNADPTCHFSPHHDQIVRAREAARRPRRPDELIFRTWPPRGLPRAQPEPVRLAGEVAAR